MEKEFITGYLSDEDSENYNKALDRIYKTIDVYGVIYTISPKRIRYICEIFGIKEDELVTSSEISDMLDKMIDKLYKMRVEVKDEV